MKSTSRLRFYLTEFHEFWCLSISAGVIRKYGRNDHTSDYIEILTCHAIILHLEDSRSHGKEAEAERSLALGARPGD